MEAISVKPKQNIAYGENKDFPSFTSNDWSTESFSGKKKSFIKWNKTCGESQKTLSSIRRMLSCFFIFVPVFERVKKSTKITIAIIKGIVFMKDLFNDSVIGLWFNHISITVKYPIKINGTMKWNSAVNWAPRYKRNIMKDFSGENLKVLELASGFKKINSAVRQRV